MFNIKGLRKKNNFKFVNNPDGFLIYFFDKVPKNLYFIEIDNNKKTRFELKISYDPFNIIYSLDNKVVVRLNEGEYLNFEGDFHMTSESELDSYSSLRLDFEYENVNNLFGLPERAYDLALTDTEEYELYRLYNIDKFIYTKSKSLGLYGSIPFIMGLSHESSIFSGMIWNNPSETYVKISTYENENTGKNNKEVLWISEAGRMDISLFADFNINNFYFKMHKYIGFAALPPASALGYHQSRWNYKDTNDLMNVDRLFDHYDIPYDSIWLDIEVNSNIKISNAIL